MQELGTSWKGRLKEQGIGACDTVCGSTIANKGFVLEKQLRVPRIEDRQVIQL